MVVEPKLGRGLSIVWTAGNPKESSVFLVAKRCCVGTSMLMIGPVSNLKKFNRQLLSRGCAIVLVCPRVNKPMHFCVWIGACMPDTTIRVGGESRVTSVTTSCHFVCNSGWSQMSVMSLVLMHAGYGSKGTANVMRAWLGVDCWSFLTAAAIFRSCPLSTGAQVSSVWSAHLVSVRSISSGGPHRCDCSSLHTLTFAAHWWVAKSTPLRLLRCRAIRPCG